MRTLWSRYGPVWLVYAVLGASALLLLPLGPAAGRREQRFVTSVGEVPLGTPLANELTEILFPNYDVGAIVRRRHVPLLEVNQFASPTVELASGAFVRVNIPPQLVAACLVDTAPDVLIFGSSRSQGALRQDILARELGAASGKPVRVVNLAIGQGTVGDAAVLLHILDEAGIRVNLVILGLDDSGLVKTSRSHVILRPFADALAAARRPTASARVQMTVPSLQQFLRDRPLAATPPPFPGFPADVAARYDAFEQQYLAGTPTMAWRDNPDAVADFTDALVTGNRVARTVMVTNPPVSDAWDKAHDWGRTFTLARALCARYDAVYLPVSKAAMGLRPEHFYLGAPQLEFDAIHLNGIGARVYSNALATAIVEQRVFPAQTKDDN